MNRPELTYKADYLYEATYSAIDYAFAYEWFRSHTPVLTGACSTVRKENLIGRNLDWKYTEDAEFIVHTDGVVGVANAVPGLTDAFVKSGADSELYKIVPFMLSDGMNKHGLFVSTLVVPADKGYNKVIYPLDYVRVTLCALMLPRYVLDNFGMAASAVYWLSAYAEVYHPKTLQDMGYDLHFVIADEDHTYCMEFVDGRYAIKNISDKPFVTNFHLSGVAFNADGSVNTPASGKASANRITPNGSGLERYNLINSYSGSIESLMRELTYTRAYQTHIDAAVPRWDTEFVGDGRTVDTPSADYDSIQLSAGLEFLDRDRSTGTTWQTIHSAVYDIENKKLRLYAQENFDTQWEVSVMAEKKLQHINRIRGNTQSCDNYTGVAGEFIINRDTQSIRIHDNKKKGGYGTIDAMHYPDALPEQVPTDLRTGAHVTVGNGRLDGGQNTTATSLAGDGLKAEGGKLVVDKDELEGDFVKKSGDTMTGSLNARSFRPQIEGFTKGETGKLVSSEIKFEDGHGHDTAANTIGRVVSGVRESGESFIALRAYKNDPSTALTTSIEVIYLADGTVRATAPAPSIESNDISIATTKFVKDLLKALNIKTPLTANKSFYVNGTTGSDTLDEGRGESAGKPFKTIQACVNYVTRNYDMSAYVAFIEVANGQYVERTLVPDFNHTTGYIHIRGASKTGCVITTTHKDNYCIQARGPVYVSRMTLIRNNQTETIAPNTASNILVANNSSGSLTITDIDIVFNAYVTQANSNCFIQAGLNGTVNINADVSLKTVLHDGAAVGGITAIDAGRDAYVSINRDITIEGPFARIARCLGGLIQRNVNTAPVFIDTNVTGKRYEVGNNGGMYIQLGTQSKTWFPGTIDGTVDAETYSWYK